ncbi:MAG TPA: hypothetical protein ENK07_04970 [Bacteroidetes bacterium]|nr:hypothetical protein [Bacteroidota bacterium]
MKRTTPSKLVVVLAIAALWVAGCVRKHRAREPVVAQVGPFAITVSDFRASYEFGPAIVKKQPKPKGAYLQAMINELLLANEGMKEGALEAPWVRRAEAGLEQELLVEQMFHDEVDSKIKISDEEIRKAIERSAVRLKARYIYASDRAEAEAYWKALKKGVPFDSVLAKSLAAHGGTPEEAETGYFTWAQLNPKIADTVFDLKAGQVSEPLPFRHGFVLVKIVDARRKVVDPADFSRLHKHYREVLQARKSGVEGGRFIKRFMDPKNVRVKREAFNALVNTMYGWLTESGKPRVGAGRFDLEKQLEQDSTRLNPGATLVEFRGGHWTVRDFLEHFANRPMRLDLQDKAHFARSLKWIIGLQVRDSFLEAEARKRGMLKREAVQRELNAWRRKWAYGEMRRRLAEQIQVSDAEAKAFYGKHRDFFGNSFADERDLVIKQLREKKLKELLLSRADSLRKQIPVEIHWDVLDTISTTDFGRPGIQLEVFKLGLPYLRKAWPTVDWIWGWDEKLLRFGANSGVAKRVGGKKGTKTAG